MKFWSIISLITVLGVVDLCRADDGLLMLRQLRGLQKIAIVRAEITFREQEGQILQVADAEKVSRYALHSLKVEEIKWSDFGQADGGELLFGRGFRAIQAGAVIPVYDRAVMMDEEQLAPLHLRKGKNRFYVLTRSTTIKDGGIPIVLTEIDEETLLKFLNGVGP